MLTCPQCFSKRIKVSTIAQVFTPSGLYGFESISSKPFGYTLVERMMQKITLVARAGAIYYQDEETGEVSGLNEK